MTTDVASPAQARILAVGTELLCDKQDTNGPEMARRLRGCGIGVEAVLQLPDRRDVLSAEIARALASPGLLVLLGGLGPTADDLTREAFADATGIAIVQDGAARARLEQWYAMRSRVVTESGLRQALLPQGAEPVQNPDGMAVGAVLRLGGSVVLMLPGPPGEIAAMIDDALARTLRLMSEAGLRTSPVPASATLVLGGIGESDAEITVRGVAELAPLSVAWLARPGEVRLVLRHEDPALVKAGVAAARAALGRDVVSVDGRALADVILGVLIEREESLATAESCTGGLVAAAITAVPGSSAAFRRGFVTYANDAKTEILGVPERLLDEHGAVSQEVAEAMASGARRAGRSDWGVGVTGIAGPGGGSEEKPVGLVHWAVARPDGRIEPRHALFSGSREDIRRRAAAAALDSVRRLL